MPLPLAVNRVLSPIEREAVELVFKDPGDPEEKSAIDPDNIRLTAVCEGKEPFPREKRAGWPLT